MPTNRLLIVAVLLAAVAAMGGCQLFAPPPHRLVRAINDLPDDARMPVRDAVWAHGNPYNWDRAENLVMDVTWTDYRSGGRAIVHNRRYVMELHGGGMRVDDLDTGSVALLKGGRWQRFQGGRQADQPSQPQPNGAAMAAESLDLSVGELRTVRSLFTMPFALLEPGVTVSSAGTIESPGGARSWRVVRAEFDPRQTGHIRGDRLLLHIEPEGGRIDRVLAFLSADPLYGVPHWVVFEQYRDLQGGLLLPGRLSFRRTDPQGVADLGQALVLQVRQAALNVPLPDKVFTDPAIVPPAPPAAEPPSEIRRMGRDVIEP